MHGHITVEISITIMYIFILDYSYYGKRSSKSCPSLPHHIFLLAMDFCLAFNLLYLRMLRHALQIKV